MDNRRALTAFGIETGVNGAIAWDTDEVIRDGDLFFNRLEAAIDGAELTIQAEFYIFSNDALGVRVFNALERAARRGVQVRLIVDGIGSAGWARGLEERAEEAGIQFKIYNELPWKFFFGRKPPGPNRIRVWDLLQRVNNRNHRKVCIIDGSTAFVGSMNVIGYHVPSLARATAWRDTGAIVSGGDVYVLSRSFDRVWEGRFKALKQRLRRKKKRPQSSALVRLNLRSQQRRENYLELLMRIARAKERVWITNAYFVPDGSLLKVLESAAQSGADVRIIVPKFSDVFFMPWVASALQYGLLEAGVKVFEYKPTVLHAKTMIIDSWAIVGSSNLNHRSLLHDLEADVVLSGQKAKEDLEAWFLEDLKASDEITLETWRGRPWLERFVGKLLLGFRYVL